MSFKRQLFLHEMTSTFKCQVLIC